MILLNIRFFPCNILLTPIHIESMHTYVCELVGPKHLCYISISCCVISLWFPHTNTNKQIIKKKFFFSSCMCVCITSCLLICCCCRFKVLLRGKVISHKSYIVISIFVCYCCLYCCCSIFFSFSIFVGNTIRSANKP